MAPNEPAQAYGTEYLCTIFGQPSFLVFMDKGLLFPTSVRFGRCEETIKRKIKKGRRRVDTKLFKFLMENAMELENIVVDPNSIWMKKRLFKN
ncbi:hypothetical protein V6N11_054530 [Hibiscus sabdariffa]|uniref:FBD domain-containing protein n=1 Tax=Hibiscus sabdariffa TaxID=183260 RepID=A0ABR2S521_9ROSI